MDTSFLNDLNDSQRQAVCYNDGPLLVVAGAGSGKTRVITYKIAYLLAQGVKPWNILALTFTNKASREMKERITGLVGMGKARYLYMGTFHSVCARLLRPVANVMGYDSNFSIYVETDSSALIKRLVKEMGLPTEKYDTKIIASIFEDAKNHLITAKEFEMYMRQLNQKTLYQIPRIIDIYTQYQLELHASNAMDFGDLIMNMNLLMRDNVDVRKKYQEQFLYVLVDEYQDTNYSQNLLVQQFGAPQNHICVVGDDSQSIYSFRGAEIGNILSFQDTYHSQLFKLEQNYRSTQTIVDASNSLITHNRHQIPKTIYSQKERGEQIEVFAFERDFDEDRNIVEHIAYLHSHDEIPYSDFTILYRTNAQSRGFEQELLKRAIPYRIYSGQSFYQRKEIKDAIAYFRLVVNNDDDAALQRIINVPSRKIGATTLQRIRDISIQEQKSLFYVLTHPALISGINSGTMQRLQEFVKMILSFGEKAQHEDALKSASFILQTSGLIIEPTHDTRAEDRDRYENLQELLRAIQSFMDERHSENDDESTFLHNFLEEVSLVTDRENASEEGEATVTLMTIHSAKGLEFPNVYIVGLEEGLFPSAQGFDCEKEIEEERRLMYVAMTRAEKKLVLSYVKDRFMYGSHKICKHSRFIDEIDKKYLNIHLSSNSSFGSKPQEGNLVPLKETIESSDKPLPNKIMKTPIVGWHSGTRVRHPLLGNGTVKEAYKDGNIDKIVVNFDSGDERTLMLTFAKLKPI